MYKSMCMKSSVIFPNWYSTVQIPEFIVPSHKMTWKFDVRTNKPPVWGVWFVPFCGLKWQKWGWRDFALQGEKSSWAGWVMDGSSKNGFLSRMNLEVTGSIMWTLWSAALGGFFFFWCFVLVRKRNCSQRWAYLQKCFLDVQWISCPLSLQQQPLLWRCRQEFGAKTTEASLKIHPLDI